jgi:hypothetical protein
MPVKTLTAAALVAAFFIAGPGTAAAIQCGDHKSLVKHLNDKFSEELAATSRDARGRAVELYRSPSGSWTLVLILDEGPACVLTAGSDRRAVETGPKGRDV